MRRLIPFMVSIVIVGCHEAEHINVQSGDISHLRIEDFNWEKMQTLVYEVSADEMTVYDKEFPDEILERVKIIHESPVWPAINRLDKIYTEQMADENVVDGTNLTFVFTLKNGEIAQTHVSNLIIEEYAAVTKSISEAVDHDIQYHQYDSKRY